jgi:hypothetical protein
MARGREVGYAKGSLCFGFVGRGDWIEPWHSRGVVGLWGECGGEVVEVGSFLREVEVKEENEDLWIGCVVWTLLVVVVFCVWGVFSL